MHFWIAIRLNEDINNNNRLGVRMLRNILSGPVIALVVLACWVGKILIVKPTADSWLQSVFFIVAWVLGAYILWFVVDVILNYTKVPATDSLC